jgi:alkylation response protein AidB-like acyl-CoA dehydrogenase
LGKAQDPPVKFKFDSHLEDFRQQVREFLRECLPADIARRTRRISFFPNESDMLSWTRILARQGWSTPNWPAEYGGPGWSAFQLHIFNEELALADAPELPSGNVFMIGPVIYTFGSAQMKERFLPPIRRGDVLFAQGFSEPGSGSDLASLQTRAEMHGDHYLVNGQKIWTSGAHRADWAFFLVKTDITVKPQLGISFLLIDLKTPGVTVRPIKQINGEVHLCSVFLDNVKVPKENLVGEAGKGWSYAKFLLDNERTASAYVHWSKRELQKAGNIARSERRNGRALMQDPVFRARFAQIEAQVLALNWSVLRVLAEEKSRYGVTAMASSLKIRGSELQQAVVDLQFTALGSKALRQIPLDVIQSHADGDKLLPGYALGIANIGLLMRAATIFGGTKQVQRNILAKMAFGL